MSNRVSHSLVSALRHVPAFADLGDPTLLELLGCSANLHWREGAIVFRRGDHAEALYVVLSGRVRIVDGDTPSDPEVATIERDEFFGELSLMLDTTHSKSAVAVGDTELMVVPREAFRQLLDGRPGLEDHFRRRMEERLAVASR